MSVLYADVDVMASDGTFTITIIIINVLWISHVYEDISDISGDTTGINNAVSAAGNVPNDIRYVVIELMELVMFMLLMLVMSMCWYCISLWLFFN